MSGEGGKVFIVPSLDLVVVRMGHEGGEERGLKILNLALGELRTAIRLKQTENPQLQRRARSINPAGAVTDEMGIYAIYPSSE